AQGASRIIVTATLLDADGFSHGNLHVINVAAVPDRLENSVGETKSQNILDGFFAQVVIDAVDLLLLHDLEQLLVQGLRRVQVATKGLLDNDPPPLVVFFRHQSDRVQLFYDRSEKVGCSGQ